MISMKRQTKGHSERVSERGRKIIRASGNSSSHSHVRGASRGTVAWALATAVPPDLQVGFTSLSVSMGSALKNHLVFSSFQGCIAEKVSNLKAASFMIYVTFDASLISNTNTSCSSTVQNHLQPKRKCGAGVGKGHRSGELRACGLVDRGKYFVISRVQLVQIQHWFCFTPRTRIWLRFQ